MRSIRNSFHSLKASKNDAHLMLHQPNRTEYLRWFLISVLAAAAFLAISLGVFDDDSRPEVADSPIARATEQLAPLLSLAMVVVASVALARLLANTPYVVSDGGVDVPAGFRLRQSHVSWSDVRAIRRRRLGLREDLVFVTDRGPVRLNLRLLADREAFVVDVFERWKGHES